MDDEEGFLLAIAANPDDLLVHLVYADWLDERDDPAGLCLRHWVELVRTPYSDTAFLALRGHLIAYRKALESADPEWVELVERARPWVNAGITELAARLYLRERHGRKQDRQWLDSPHYSSLSSEWRVSYWPNGPAEQGQRRHRAFRHLRLLKVDPRTAEVSE